MSFSRDSADFSRNVLIPISQYFYTDFAIFSYRFCNVLIPTLQYFYTEFAIFLYLFRNIFIPISQYFILISQYFHTDFAIFLYRFSILAPWFINRPSRITYTKLGDKLVVKCNADGVPKPATVISKIRPNGFRLLGNIIGSVKGIHLGIYECKAVNKHGMIKYPFLIKIRGEFQRYFS